MLTKNVLTDVKLIFHHLVKMPLMFPCLKKDADFRTVYLFIMLRKYSSTLVLLSVSFRIRRGS